MRTILQTTIKGQPVAWARARGGGGDGTDEPGNRQRSFYTAKPQARFKRVVKDEARLAMLTGKARGLHKGKPALRSEPVIFDGRVYLEIPKSFSVKDKAAALAGDLRPTTKPDLDNWLKLPMDACEGIAYSNDSQVVGFGGSGVWYSDKPRLELHIYHAEKAGEFLDFVRALVGGAIFDPGNSGAGFKGERTLTDWQTDALILAMRASGRFGL